MTARTGHRSKRAREWHKSQVFFYHRDSWGPVHVCYLHQYCIYTPSSHQASTADFPHTARGLAPLSTNVGQFLSSTSLCESVPPSTRSHQVKGNCFARLKDKRLSKWKNCLWIRKGHTLPVVRRWMYDVPSHSFQVQMCVSHHRVTLNHFTWAGELIWDCWAALFITLVPNTFFPTSCYFCLICFLNNNWRPFLNI